MRKKQVSQQHSKHITSLKEINTSAFTRKWHNHTRFQSKTSWRELCWCEIKMWWKKIMSILHIKASKHLLCWCTWSEKSFFFSQQIRILCFIVSSQSTYMCIYSPAKPNQGKPLRGSWHHLLMCLLLLLALIFLILNLLHLHSTIRLSWCVVFNLLDP